MLSLAGWGIVAGLLRKMAPRALRGQTVMAGHY